MSAQPWSDVPGQRCGGVLVAGTTAWDTILRVDDLPGPDTARRASTIVDVPGGCAANTAVALARFGHEPVLLSAVGGDFDEVGLREHLASAGVELGHVHHEPDAVTARAVLTTDDRGRQTIAYQEGATPSMTSLEPVGASIGHFAPGEITAYPDLMAACEAVTYDPGQETFYRAIDEVLAPVPLTDVLLVNEHEAERIAEAYGGVEPLLEDVGAILVSDEKGQRLLTEDRSLRLDAVPADPVDLTGAGDAFDAGFVHGLHEGWPLEDAACFGSVVAAFAIEALGAQEGLPTLDEAIARFEQAYGEQPG